jgi:putative restriction endonuclease
MYFTMDTDLKIRLSAFQWLEAQSKLHGDVFHRTLLEAGFVFEDERIPLVSPSGIFKPRLCKYPISITTIAKSDYKDKRTEDGYLAYKYRGTDPAHRDNQGLRDLMRLNVPLIYFYGFLPGKYLAEWPVSIIGDDPENLTFTVRFDEMRSIQQLSESTETKPCGNEEDSSRKYSTSTRLIRLHQRSFREKILDAYRTQCAMCRLKHRELLDAAHILPDEDPEGYPIVKNGIALCKLHHAAFDMYFIGIDPDYRVKVREDILLETDGPMLLHGLQQLHDRKIELPHARRNWPNKMNLEKKFSQFKKAI